MEATYFIENPTFGAQVLVPNVHELQKMKVKIK